MTGQDGLMVSCQRCGGRTFTLSIILPGGIVVRCCGCGLTVPDVATLTQALPAGH